MFQIEKMSPQLRERKRVSLSSHLSRDESEVSPPKRKLTARSTEKEKVNILQLPEKLFHVILSHIDLQQLCAVSQVCHQFNKYTMSFVKTSSSIPIIFPSMTVDLGDQTGPLFFISGSEKKYSLNKAEAVTNFKQLGILVKKMTCLLPTRERIVLCTRLMARLSPCTVMSPTSTIMSLCGTFIHQIVRGWADKEVVLAARLVFLTFNSGDEGCVSSILAPGYPLGSRPDTEMHVRNFLSSVFYKEVAFGQEHLWLEALLYQSCSAVNNSDTSMISRVLLLMSSPAKEESLQFGVQWEDHVEAIPASLSVASSRYHFLVCLINTLRKGQYSTMIPTILSSVFSSPSPWLPENVGSVLLLLGYDVCFLYLQHLINKLANRCDMCTNCFKDISVAIIGLALMTARFRWSFAPVIARMEEVIMQVSPQYREDMLRAIWKALAEEVTDIRQSVGEDWATESSMHLFKVIRLIGQRMTEKAFMPLPPSSAQEKRFNIEE